MLAALFGKKIFSKLIMKSDAWYISSTELKVKFNNPKPLGLVCWNVDGMGQLSLKLATLAGENSRSHSFSAT